MPPAHCAHCDSRSHPGPPLREGNDPLYVTISILGVQKPIVLGQHTIHYNALRLIEWDQEWPARPVWPGGGSHISLRHCPSHHIKVSVGRNVVTPPKPGERSTQHLGWLSRQKLTTTGKTFCRPAYAVWGCLRDTLDIVSTDVVQTWTFFSSHSFDMF